MKCFILHTDRHKHPDTNTQTHTRTDKNGHSHRHIALMGRQRLVGTYTTYTIYPTHTPTRHGLVGTHTIYTTHTLPRAVQLPLDLVHQPLSHLLHPGLARPQHTRGIHRGPAYKEPSIHRAYTEPSIHRTQHT